MMHKTWSSIEEVSYCFQGHPSNFKVTRDKKIADFDHNRAFPGCNSSLNSPMALKWCTNLNVVFKRCPIVFHRHPSNFKVTGDKKKTPILTLIGRFRTVTPVWIQWWLWNGLQSLKQHRRDTLLFFKVTRQISRSYATKNCQYWPN